MKAKPFKQVKKLCKIRSLNNHSARVKTLIAHPIFTLAQTCYVAYLSKVWAILLPIYLQMKLESNLKIIFGRRSPPWYSTFEALKGRFWPALWAHWFIDPLDESRITLRLISSLDPSRNSGISLDFACFLYFARSSRSMAK